MTTVGLIADTHGLVRPEALRALGGSDLVVHAGDVGGAEVLEALGRIAPVRAVRGNNDRGAWASDLPVTDVVEVDGLWLYVVHEEADLDLEPMAAGIAAVVTGHSHRPSVLERRGVLFVNPGSAGPRRFRLPVTVGRLVVAEGRVRAETIDLAIDG
jgi:putative phosphoesterase